MSPTPDRTTQVLLTCGALAAPLFFAAVLVQDYTRTDGYDPRRHPLSMLSLGDLGWIQSANFAVTGLLFIAFAAGLRRLRRPGHEGIWGPVLLGAFGLGLIAAGIFVPDPAWGFPPGAPAGRAPVPTATGYLHALAGFTAFTGVTAASLVFARRFARRRQARAGWLCSAAAVVTYGAFLGSSPASGGGEQGRPLSLLLRLGALAGWGWASLLAAYFLRTRPSGPTETAG
ncbi:hypothetical protein Sru01_47510 [Sphaerisporangium rufum]|uniref:DUF998 domain-containing protein n=1 Tax=Sphaerisporangium rufum TaxID=1381558 RepID=A0A919V1I4_9ACTN|nr:DUF998 domain-containing protein [Sphaerisporangium rufum]GII79769.1 hypothetical protein Sru01_47510 [Sphaerisporangium rufum]